jgi:hypothetical protein
MNTNMRHIAGEGVYQCVGLLTYTRRALAGTLLLELYTPLF